MSFIKFAFRLGLSGIFALLAILLTLVIAWPTNAAQLKVFPGAEGFGTHTPAGRGGAVIKVTNLNDRGAGSLRAALETSGPRIVVFEVGGTIRLNSDLNIRHPFITVSGQSAPAPGIMLRGAGIRITTHDVLVQHLRIRVGDDPFGPHPSNRDAIQVLGPSSYNVVIDHISASWAIDETMSTWYAVRDITFSNNFMTESLNRSLHPKGPHSKGLLIGDHARNITVIGNLIAHHIDRNPQVKGDVSAIVLNNLIYNAGNRAYLMITDNYAQKPSLVSAIGNIFRGGPDTPMGAHAIQIAGSAKPGTKIYQAENQSDFPVFRNSATFDPVVSSPPVWLAGITVRDTRMLAPWILDHAGARASERDDVDRRIVEEVKSGRGRIIDSQKEVGGWPTLIESRRKFVIPANGDDSGDGYTNIEKVLHQMAADVEGRTPLKKSP